MKLYGLDLFSGIGGNTLGLRDWIKTVAYCEQDKYAQSVLLSRMADGSIEPAPIWDDVVTLKGTDLEHPIDIIIAGFPCQDISCANRKGAGILGGKRSGLFFEIMRLAQEVKPTFIFLENVPAIRTRGLDTVLKELDDSGYDCRWCMLSAAEVGAPHKRERWFALACRREALLPYAREVKKDELFSVGEEGIVADTNGSRNVENAEAAPNLLAESQGQYSGISGNRSECENDEGSDRKTGRSKEADESDLGRMADGFFDDVDDTSRPYLHSSYWDKEPEGIPRVTDIKTNRVKRLKCLGNAVVPLQARTAFRYLLTGVLKVD